MKMKRVTPFILALTVLVSCVAFMPTVKVSATGEWADVYIKQHEVLHPRGCTVVTLQLILQNSDTLKSEWQLPAGRVPTRTWRDNSVYDKFDIEGAASPGISGGVLESEGKTSDSVLSGNMASFASRVCESDVTWEQVSDGSVGSESIKNPSSSTVVCGFGSSDFHDMDKSKIITSFKAIYNAGYWAVIAISYNDGTETSNGPEGYRANHWVMFSGVDDSNVYINDPAYGKGGGFYDNSDWAYYSKIEYVVLYKNNKTSPLSLSGGRKASMTQTDMSNAQALGLSSSFITGDMASSAWASNMKLAEADLSGELDSAQRENLKQDDRESLAAWQMNVESDKLSLTDIIRTVVVFVGIVFTLWGILIYLAFWFDHINTIFYVDVLHLVTFGQLHICPPGEKPTFHMGKEKKDRTVSHKQIVCISGMCVLFGVLLISGTFYTIVQKFVRLITSFLS